MLRLYPIDNFCDAPLEGKILETKTPRAAEFSHVSLQSATDLFQNDFHIGLCIGTVKSQRNDKSELIFELGLIGEGMEPFQPGSETFFVVERLGDQMDRTLAIACRRRRTMLVISHDSVPY
jgi:hypothetical protein